MDSNINQRPNNLVDSLRKEIDELKYELDLFESGKYYNELKEKIISLEETNVNLENEIQNRTNRILDLSKHSGNNGRYNKLVPLYAHCLMSKNQIEYFKNLNIDVKEKINYQLLNGLTTLLLENNLVKIIQEYAINDEVKFTAILEVIMDDDEIIESNVK